MNYRIAPYTEEYAQKLAMFEQGIVQGKQLRLEICKQDVMDRANVFDQHVTYMALSEMDEIVGMSSGGRTTLEINGIAYPSGIGFDTKVHPNWRNRGIAKKLAQTTVVDFFEPNGLIKNYSTVKFSNKAVFKIFTDVLAHTDSYEFVYLTIPTHLRLSPFHEVPLFDQRFHVRLFDRENLSPDYWKVFDNGLGYFRTDQLFQLKITRIAPLFKLGIALLQSFQPEKYRFAPKEGDLFSYATLFDHTNENIGQLQSVLDDLAKKGIRHLMVCCQKGDPSYRWLRKWAIDEYRYVILSDFELKPTDQVSLDVRSL